MQNLSHENLASKNQSPSWDIQSEYPSLQSNLFQKDILEIQSHLNQLKIWALELSSDPLLEKSSSIDLIQKFFVKQKDSFVLQANISTYLNCLLSVDAKDSEAEAKRSELSVMFGEIQELGAVVSLIVKTISDEKLKLILDHPELKTFEFTFTQERLLQDFVLSEDEEKLVIALGRSGHHGWSQLYNAIAGNLKCQIHWPTGIQEVGLAMAHSYLRSEDENTRRLAWESIQSAWQTHRESAAAILNNLADWRHQLNSKRSQKKEVHFLDSALYGGRISQKTLSAMLSACEAQKFSIQKANKMMAQLMGKKQLGPWDILAECPVAQNSELKTFDQAMDIIISAFSEVSVEMADFARMMKVNNWIEGRLLPNKRNGAYCTGFAKSRTPRVFMSFRGSNKDLMTLAHEIGHAFHSWVMRDLPQELCRYPMTLAETASVFAETVVQNYLMKNAKSKADQIEFAWIAAESASSFLLNIPARFDFEKSLYEKRKQRALSADELCTLTDEAWSKWYGESLSENDKMFWAHKLHFHMSGISFYNFPYTFGYLFSLAIYSKQAELGSQFYAKYVAILRDTGAMSAEALVQKHLHEDIESEEFWNKAIQIVQDQLAQMESLIV